MEQKLVRLLNKLKTFEKFDRFVPIGFLILLIGALTFVISYAIWHGVNVLEARGTIAASEKHLIAIALGLSAIVVVPVFALTIGIAWNYRETNPRQKKYSPEWDGSRALESIWWGVPLVIIAVLSVITWNSSHQLDPFRKLVSDKQPLTVQVVALDWKWLFIYPQQHVASVNYLQLPVNTPVHFEITSDTVMNSFWIPQLGGQIYAMPGMTTQLHLMATNAGSYYGSSANISGDGFAGMHFMAKADSNSAFATWVATAATAAQPLTAASYTSLAKPSQYNRAAYYPLADSNLYDDIVMKYDYPANTMSGMSGMSGSGMHMDMSQSMSGMHSDMMMGRPETEAN